MQTLKAQREGVQEQSSTTPQQSKDKYNAIFGEKFHRFSFG
jgi:hypothetical protein